MAAETLTPLSAVGPRILAEATEMTDRELICSLQAHPTDAVFEELYRRYSAIVYSTALRILTDPSAAEDATQATFIVFIKRRSDLSADTVLAGWFYTAARKCALVIRRSVLRRNQRERKAFEMKQTASTSGAWREVSPEFDQELAALPENQRNALILRYFHGLSLADAARMLGCPELTLQSRLKRGLATLRERFARRGVAISGITVAELLSEKGMQAAPKGISSSILPVCSGNAAASPVALTTANSVVKGMVLAKVKAVIAVAALMLAVSAPVAYLGTRAVPISPVPKKLSTSHEVSPGTDTPPVKLRAGGEMPGTSTLFNEDFTNMRSGTWEGVRNVTFEPGNAVMGPVRVSDNYRFFFRIRTPKVRPGWTAHPGTYLRFRYLAQNLTENEGLKIQARREDEVNIGGFFLNLRNEHWETLTISLDELTPVDNPRQRAPSDSQIVQLTWLVYTRAPMSPPPSAKFFIDDVSVFRTGEAIAITHLRPEN